MRLAYFFQVGCSYFDRKIVGGAGGPVMECLIKPYSGSLRSLLVDNKQFRKLKAADLKEKIVIDTRGIIV